MKPLKLHVHPDDRIAYEAADRLLTDWIRAESERRDTTVHVDAFEAHELVAVRT